MDASEKTEPTLVTLASLTPILKLDKLQIKAITRLYDNPADDASLPRYVVLHLLLADLLERLAFLKPSQRQSIVDMYDQDIGENLPQWETLAFADGNWVTWTGYTGWYDLTTGEDLNKLPAPPVETIGYNLIVLYERAIAQIRKRTSNASKHPAGSVDQS